jgi:hypothetical protein
MSLAGGAVLDNVDASTGRGGRPGAAEEAGLTKKAAIYLRVSTFKQIRPDHVEGLSIPEQRLNCQQKAAQLGAGVALEYVDHASAKTAAGRPALQRMLADLKLRKDIDYVIVWKLDGFARKRFDEAIVGQQLEDLGIEFISVSENIDNSVNCPGFDGDRVMWDHLLPSTTNTAPQLFLCTNPLGVFCDTMIVYTNNA